MFKKCNISYKIYYNFIKKRNLYNIINKYSKIDEPIKFDWIIFYTISLIMALFTIHHDSILNASHSILFYEALFSGNITQFYTFCSKNIDRSFGIPAWEITIYMIGGVLFLPLYIINKIFLTNPLESFIGLVYIKFTQLLFIYLSARSVFNILIISIKNNKTAKWCMLLFMSSYQILFVSIGMGQWDIIPIFFMLKMMEKFLIKDFNRFLIYSTVAFTVKNFSFFLFVPLLLLYEKSLLKVIYKILLSFTLLVVYKIIFFQDLIYKIGQKELKMFILGSLVGHNNIPISLVPSLSFILFWMLICIYAYTLKLEEHNYKYNCRLVFL